MSVNREELKRMIDRISEQDALEVYDFIGYLNMKREREAPHQIEVDSLIEDMDLVRQIQKSQEDRRSGRIYTGEHGLEYLRRKVEEFENGQSL